MDMQNHAQPKKISSMERIEQRINKLERQKRAIQARENQQKRKARTRRLIQIGAIAVKYLGCPKDIEPEEFEKLIKSLVHEINKSHPQNGTPVS